MENSNLNDLIIVKRTGQRVSFNGTKIALAIKKAFDSVNQETDPKDVNKIYEKVLKNIEQNYKDRKTINVEDIQDIIETVLNQSNYTEVYQAFSEYRLKRAASREVFEVKQQHKFVKAMERLILSAKKDTKQNPLETLTSFGKIISSEFAKAYLIDAKYVRSHEEGSIYIHNLDEYVLGTTKSSVIDLSKIKPRDNYMPYLTNLLVNIKKEQYGEHTIASLDYELVPYFVDTYKKYLIEELYREFKEAGILEYIDFDSIEDEIELLDTIEIDFMQFKKYIKSKKVEEIWKNSMDQALRNTKAWVKKELFLCLMSLEHNDTAIGSNNYAISIGTNSSTIGRMLNQIILEIYKKESFRKVYLIFKVKEGINYKTGPLTDLLEQVIECVHENKNIRLSFLDATFNQTESGCEVEYLPSGKRILDNINPDKRVSKGRILLATTSINLVRIALATKEKEAFYTELAVAIEHTKNELLQAFESVASKYKDDFKYLFQENIFLDSEKLDTNGKIRKILRSGTLDINITGLYEASLYLEKEASSSLALEILTFIRKKADEISQNERLNFVVSETLNEKVRSYFLAIDKSIYGSIPGVTDKERYDTFSDAFLADQDHRLERTGEYQKLTNGGHLLKIKLAKNVSLKKIQEIIQDAHQNDIGYLDMKVRDGT